MRQNLAGIKTRERNRQSRVGPDPIPSDVDTIDFDELWLFAAKEAAYRV